MKTVIQKDAHGLFVRAGGYVARPGGVRGYDHVYQMGSGALVGGEIVKAYHKSQTPLTKITLDNGMVLHWHHDPHPRSVEINKRDRDLQSLRAAAEFIKQAQELVDSVLLDEETTDAHLLTMLDDGAQFLQDSRDHLVSALSARENLQ